MKSFTVISTMLALFAGPLVFTFGLEAQNAATKVEIEAQVRNITDRGQNFGFRVLMKMFDVKKDLDFMISPSALWSAILLLMEGSHSGSLHPLRYTKIIVNEDISAVRRAFNVLQNASGRNTSSEEISTWLEMFMDTNQQIYKGYQSTLKTYYGTELQLLNFTNSQNTTDFINNRTKIATRGLIENTFKNVEKAKLLIISTLYLKGQWKIPFDPRQTKKKPFHDINGEATDEVDMMATQAPLKYIIMSELNATVLELPYGAEERLSMLVLMPNLGVTLNEVIWNVHTYDLKNISKKFAEKTESIVKVHLPRFSTTTNLPLKIILEEEDIVGKKQYIDIIKGVHIMHSSKIIVNEGEREHATVSTNEMILPQLSFDRPFVYLIVEKDSNLLLCAGKFENKNK